MMVLAEFSNIATNVSENHKMHFRSNNYKNNHPLNVC